MHRFTRYAACALLMLTAVAASAAELTEQGVSQLIKSMDAAIARKDAATVAGLMSPDVKIRMTISSQGQNQTLTPNRDQYLQMLKEGWAVYTDYRYSRTGTRIALERGKAVVTATVRETMKVQGQPVSGVSDEEVTIELVQDKPMITRVTGNSRM